MDDDPFATRRPPTDDDPHATVHRPLPSTHDMPVVDTPVRIARRPRRSRLRRLGGPASIVAGLAGAGLIGYALHSPTTPVSDPGPQPSLSPAPIAITGLTIASKVGVLHCPSAVLRLAGTIRSNGSAGTARLAWSLPTGQTSPQSVTIPAGSTSTEVTLNFTLTGRGSSRGEARLHLLSPVNVFSAPVPVRYVCP